MILFSTERFFSHSDTKEIKKIVDKIRWYQIENIKPLYTIQPLPRVTRRPKFSLHNTHQRMEIMANADDIGRECLVVFVCICLIFVTMCYSLSLLYVDSYYIIDVQLYKK